MNRLRRKAGAISLWIAMGIVLLVILYLLIFGRHSGPSWEDIRDIESKIRQLERRLLESEKTVRLEVAELQGRIVDLQRSLASGNNPKTKRAEEFRYYEVKPGDTLTDIARENDLTIQELCRLNNLSFTDIIRPGQMLLVNSGS